MFSRFEMAVASIANEKTRMADCSGEALRDEPDWLTFARQANDVLRLEPGTDLTAAVERLATLANDGGIECVSIIVGADDRAERAFMAIRLLRSRVVGRQERVDASDGEVDKELVTAPVMVLDRYLDYDRIFLAAYEVAPGV